MNSSIIYSFDLWFAIVCLVSIHFIQSKIYQGGERGEFLFRLLRSFFMARIAEVAIGFSPGELLITTLCITIVLYIIPISHKIKENEP